MPATIEMSDATIIDFLRRHGTVSVADLVDFTGVTATAVRQRLVRLMDQGWIQREALKAGRGRPTHRYSLTKKGLRSCGSNCDDLSKVLWSEIREIDNDKVRQKLLRRVSDQLKKLYQDRVDGKTKIERIDALVALMEERNVPFESKIKPTKEDPSKKVPVLTALACPYPELSEEDRMVCALERMLFTELLGAKLHMVECRLDGDNCCSYEIHDAS